MSFARRQNKVAAQNLATTMFNENSACMRLFCHSLDPSSNTPVLFSFPHPHFRATLLRRFAWRKVARAYLRRMATVHMFNPDPKFMLAAIEMARASRAAG